MRYLYGTGRRVLQGNRNNLNDWKLYAVSVYHCCLLSAECAVGPVMSWRMKCIYIINFLFIIPAQLWVDNNSSEMDFTPLEHIKCCCLSIWMTGSRHTLEYGKFIFNIRFSFCFFPRRWPNDWHSLPSTLVESPSWEVFRNWQEMALSNLLSWDMLWARSWTSWLPGSLPAWIIWLFYSESC